MEKVIVNRENYEEVMFNLLENEYVAEVQNDILNQIKTDVFLSFEWEQWKKSFYTESIEKYRFENIEFIESLIKKEPRRIAVYAKRAAIAASLLLLVTVYFLLRNQNNYQPTDKNKQIVKQSETVKKLKQDKAEQMIINSEKQPTTVSKNDKNIESNSTVKDTSEIERQSPEISLKFNITKTIDSIKEVYVNTPVAKKSRYNISVKTNDVSQNDMHYASLEKRYTLKDVENKKDGITIQKFLVGSKSRIVDNLASNKKVLELYTSDNYVLEIELSK